MCHDLVGEMALGAFTALCLVACFALGVWTGKR